MPRRCRVGASSHSVFPHHFVQDVPDLRGYLVHQLFGHLDGGGVALGHQLMENEGLEELQGHLLGKTALATRSRSSGPITITERPE